MYGRHNYVRDGGMTLGLMLDLLANTDNTLSQEIGHLPPSFTAKDKISCSKGDIDKIISHLLFLKLRVLLEMSYLRLQMILKER